jgi:hypothetical protein
VNENELLETLADQAPLPPADYPTMILKRARRARRVRALAIGGGSVAVVVVLLLTQMVLRPGGGLSLPPAQPERSYAGVVYLKPATPAEHRSAIQSTLDRTYGVSNVRLVTQEEALRQFARMFKDAPDVVASVRSADMPESFEFEASAIVDRRDLLRRLSVMQGVSFAASPVSEEISPSAPPSPDDMAMPEMGVPEARFYAEQLTLLAKAVWASTTPPKTIYVVDGFCRAGKVHVVCPQQRFSTLLQAELQNRMRDYAEVVFVAASDGADPVAQDALLANLGPLTSHRTGGQTLWLEVRSAESSEYAEFEVSWDGGRWVAGQWTGGSVSTTSR